jgi:hypothetical protein
MIIYASCKPIFQVFHLDVAYVAMTLPACFKCFIYFVLMLQVFHLDVTKVDLNVTYVVMPIHVCFKRIFKCFICFRRM